MQKNNLRSRWYDMWKVTCKRIKLSIYLKTTAHILTTLHNDHPSRVIIHAGTKDVHENVRVTDVVKRIIDIGVMYRSFGVNNISISSVLLCKDISLNKIIDEIYK